MSNMQLLFDLQFEQSFDTTDLTHTGDTNTKYALRQTTLA